MKFLYLTLISCFLFLSCESDDSPYKSDVITADYKVQLLDENTEKFEFSFSNEDGIFGFVKSSKNEYKKAIQIRKDGTIETLFSAEFLQEPKYNFTPKLTGVKQTSSETLETTELYLLVGTKIYKYQKSDKSLRFYRELDKQNRINNFSHVPHTDYFISFNDSNNSIGYFSILSNDSQYQFIESTIGKAYFYWDPNETPVFHANSIYFLNQGYTESIVQMTYTEFSKTSTFEFHTIFSKIYNYTYDLQIDSNGNLYALDRLGYFVHLNAETQKYMPVFISNAKPLKYKIQYFNTSETGILDVFPQVPEDKGFIINTVKNFMVLDNDLYIIQNQDLMKIPNFKNQLINTSPL